MANEIVYGFAETPFGTIIVARTIDGICDLQFLGWNRMEVIHELASHWGVYTPTTQNDLMADTVKRVIFDEYAHPLKLDLQGTDFQKRVWNELLKVKKGETLSYQELAERIGQSSARCGFSCGRKSHCHARTLPQNYPQRRHYGRISLGT